MKWAKYVFYIEHHCDFKHSWDHTDYIIIEAMFKSLTHFKHENPFWSRTEPQCFPI